MKPLLITAALLCLSATACTFEAGGPPPRDHVIVQAPAPRDHVVVRESFSNLDVQVRPPIPFVVERDRRPEFDRHREWRREEYRPGYRGHDWDHRGDYREHRGW